MQFNFKRRMLMLAGLGSCLWSARAAVTDPPVVLVLGDSLSAEYGLQRGRGWVALLTKQLRRESANAQVINASISGETTSGGRTRLPALLKQHRPRFVVIELGANDALRGLPLRSSKANLSAMISASKAQGAQVVLVGMQMPPNYGKRYADDFARLFDEVAKAQRCALVPFFLQGVADRADARDWFQADGIHPLEKAHPIMLDNVWKVLRPLLLGCQSRA
jgi:acyl-CoA thioesterase-1